MRGALSCLYKRTGVTGVHTAEDPSSLPHALPLCLYHHTPAGTCRSAVRPNRASLVKSTVLELYSFYFVLTAVLYVTYISLLAHICARPPSRGNGVPTRLY